MKIGWININITLCIVALLLVAQDTNADTQEQAIAYLKKYKIPYHHKLNEASNIINDGALSLFDKDKKSDEDELLKAVKYYRDSVVMNLDLFGEKVDRLLKGVQIKLEKQHQINKNNIEALIELLQHGLRRLELRGELTREKVFTELDKLKRKAIERHIVNEAQWKQLVNDIAGSFASDAWFRRFLGGRYHLQHETDDDGFSRWKRYLENRLKKANKRLSPVEVEKSIDTVERAIHNTPDPAKLGDPRWWRRVERDLKRTLNNPDLVHDVVDSVRDDINAYKIFAMDYAPEEIKSWIQEWREWAHDLWNEFIQWLFRQYHDVNTPEALRASSSYAVIEAHSRSVDSAAHSAESAIQSFTHAVDQTTTQWKKSFAKFWLEQEKQAYKRIGYTEAHLEWVYDHLEKTIRDNRNVAKHNIDASLYQIRRYLQEARVQSATQIEHQITRIQNLLEIWKQSLPTQRVEL